MWKNLLLASATAAFWSPLASASTLSSKRATSLNSNMTMEAAQFFPQHHSQRVKIRYGPFSVVPMDVDSGMSTYTVPEAEMPCQDCLITFMQAGLEYPNGTVANADTNLWLHHTVFVNLGRVKTACPDQIGDQFFASGNERTPINICANGTDQAGYYVASDDKFAYLIELMNMEMTPQEGVLTVTWEYIPSLPSGFDQVKALWLDIGGCLGSSDQPAKNDGAFSYTSPPWVSDFSGRITFMGAHLHDGGTHLTIKSNSTLECDCVAKYGQSPAYIGGGMSMGTSSATMSMTMSMPMSSSSSQTSIPTTSTSSMPTASMADSNIHISNISTCTNKGLVNIGDKWTVTAYYDGIQHALMTDTNGTLAPIMGIAILYVADNNLTSTATNTTGSSSSSSAAATSTPTSGAERILVLGSAHVMLSVVLSALAAAALAL